jgi:hypothetical protein
MTPSPVAFTMTAAPIAGSLAGEVVIVPSTWMLRFYKIAKDKKDKKKS